MWERILEVGLFWVGSFDVLCSFIVFIQCTIGSIKKNNIFIKILYCFKNEFQSFNL